MTAKFRSCFIVDVVVNEKDIVLTDSSLCTYHMLKDDKLLMDEFKSWLKNTFLKGVAQTLTVFQYERIDISECEFELRIVKFLEKDKALELA